MIVSEMKWYEKDKDKLLTKADALSIFTTNEDLANTKSEIIKCPPDWTGRDGWFLDRNNRSAFWNYVCHVASLFEIILLYLEIPNLKK